GPAGSAGTANAPAPTPPSSHCPTPLTAWAPTAAAPSANGSTPSKPANLSAMLRFAALSCLLLLGSLCASASTPPTLTPGTVVTLDFPELGPMHDQKPAACEVHIPASYDPAKPVPLLVWFGGGKGSSSVDGANGLVDFDTFVVAALPYPDGYFPRLAAKDGKVDGYWDFHRVMLERIRRLVPNI